MKKHDIVLYSGTGVLLVILMIVGFTQDGFSGAPTNYVMGVATVFFLACAWMEDHSRNRREKKHRKDVPSLFGRMKKQAQPTRN